MNKKLDPQIAPSTSKPGNHRMRLTFEADHDPPLRWQGGQRGGNRLRCVREVDVNQWCLPAEIDPLHPAWYLCSGKALGGELDINPSSIEHGNAGQRVAHVEFPGQPEQELDRVSLQAGDHPNPAVRLGSQ